MRVFQDGSHRSSRCKLGDRNFGSVAIAPRQRASGVWEEVKKVGEVLRLQMPSRHGTIYNTRW